MGIKRKYIDNAIKETTAAQQYKGKWFRERKRWLLGSQLRTRFQKKMEWNVRATDKSSLMRRCKGVEVDIGSLPLPRRSKWALVLWPPECKTHVVKPKVAQPSTSRLERHLIGVAPLHVSKAGFPNARPAQSVTLFCSGWWIGLWNPYGTVLEPRPGRLTLFHYQHERIS